MNRSLDLEEIQYIKLLKDLKARIPKKDLEMLWRSDMLELDENFLGFINIYAPLEYIVPTEMTIIDFGCHAAAQSYYFINHKKYIGVDLADKELNRIFTPNAVHYSASIQDFIKTTKSLDKDNCFAICSYVPDSEARAMVKDNFENCRIYYPGEIDYLHLSR